MRTRGVLAGLALLAALSPPTAGAETRPIDSRSVDSANLARVATFPRKADPRPNIDRGGTDLAFDGRYVYAADQGRDGKGGGVQIIDAGGPKPRVMSYLACGGWQNDVAVVRPGLIALGYHGGAGNCGNRNGGLTLVDVSNPIKPRVIASTPELIGATEVPDGLAGVHTITPFPGTSLIYASPGGRQTTSGSLETIVDVADPRRPAVVATFETAIGCHDVTFDIRKTRQLGFCSGIGATQVWDVSDPLAPKPLSVIVNPLHRFQHSAAVSSDGNMLVVGTETETNDCAGGPTGALVVYDISDPKRPTMTGWYGAQRGAEPVYSYPTDLTFDELCAPHQFNIVPGTRTVVSGNGSGGVNVVDFSDPLAPKELGYYLSSDRDYFAAYWHNGRIFANAVQGVDVFELPGKRTPAPSRPRRDRPKPTEFPRSGDGPVCFTRATAGG